MGRKRVQNEIPLAVTLGSKSLAFIRRGRSQMHTKAGKKKSVHTEMMQLESNVSSFLL